MQHPPSGTVAPSREEPARSNLAGHGPDAPGVSVVIPCFNGAGFLAEAIDSALAQDYAPLEVIVLDDGSTDASAQVAAAYGPKVRYYYQENAGLSAARNAAIARANFPLIALLDADDRLLPGSIAVMAGTLRSLPADYAMVACQGHMMDHLGNPIRHRSHARPYEGPVSARQLILMNRFHSSALIKREVFAVCGFFDTALRSSEDRDMWIRIAARFRIHLLGGKWVWIRRHAHNMSKNAVAQSRGIRRVLTKAWQAQTVSRLDLLFWLQAVSIYLFQSAFMYAEAGCGRAAAVRFLGSLGLWPFFRDSRAVGQPAWFRVRRLGRIVLESLPGLRQRPAVEAPVRETLPPPEGPAALPQ